MSAPLANFDSLGATHRNKFDNILLTKQWVTTPHFNRYNEQGRRIAYKTPPLTDPEALRQLTDVANCIIMFYDEFNIRHIPADYPRVLLRAESQQDLFPEPATDDPLAYVARY